ncbi:MAG TPA: hypothetical protein VEU09_01315 [Candidatus Binatia bacterium]|nr:hypothetical protein [Candidatus Binatia bacterium]
MAVLALWLITAGGRAWGQVPPAPAIALERAAALVRSHAFDQAVVLLRGLLSADPTNRGAQEMLAFALESKGDLEGERRVRTALVAEFPGDPRIQTDYGRVLERAGDEGGALRAYRRARDLSAGGPAPDLDAAIERMKGRTTLEVGAPLSVMSDPDATASVVQAGAAVPLGSRQHLALLGTRWAAEAKSTSGATESAELGVSLVRRGTGASWTVGPRLHVVSARGAARRDVAVGGVITGRAPVGRSFEAEGRVEAETPWNDAAITMLRGGRSTCAEGHLYVHALSRRLLLQAGARRRRLSILSEEFPRSRRPAAWQSLWLVGADAVLWRPGAAIRGEMLDEAMVAPTTLVSAMTLAYRHYDLSTQTTPDFDALIGLAPRGSVNEGSVATTVASPQGRLGLEVRAGLSRDSVRRARAWRAGGALVWAPTRATRVELGYEGATEVTSGLMGQRRTGWLSVHADL